MVRAARTSPEPAALQKGGVSQSLAQTGLVPIEKNGEPSAAPRFRIFIVDSGWNSPAHRVLQENFALIRDLQKEDPIYVLGREKSIEFMRHNQSRIGRDPVIVVHDLEALDKGGTAGFHGFRVNLGLLRTPQQALLALQNFARFLSTHRQSTDLEVKIRAHLRREGLGARSRLSYITRRAKSVNDR